MPHQAVRLSRGKSLRYQDDISQPQLVISAGNNSHLSHFSEEHVPKILSMSLYELLFGATQETKRKHSECFGHSNIDRMQCHRVVPMQVLSLGMSRTGTASIYAALSILGYETWHGFRAFASIRDYDMWNPACETKFFNSPSAICPKADRAFFDKILGHVSAITDMPPVCFATELIEAYPEAKIILVERDPDEWLKSFESVFIKTYDSSMVQWICWMEPAVAGRLGKALHRGTAEGKFRAKTTEEFRANAKIIYKEHYAEIRKCIKERGEEDRLLEYDLRSGWEPLCQFLGKDVPVDTSFPRVNETEIIQERIRVMLMLSVRRTAWKATKVVLPLILAGVAARYFQLL